MDTEAQDEMGAVVGRGVTVRRGGARDVGAGAGVMTAQDACVMQFLALGEAMFRLYRVRCKDSHYVEAWQDLPGDPIEEVDRQMKRVLQMVPSDAHCGPLRRVIKRAGGRRPLPGHLAVLALVGFCDGLLKHSGTSPDHIARMASCHFSERALEGVLMARRIIAQLLRIGALELTPDNLVLGQSLQRWSRPALPAIHDDSPSEDSDDDVHEEAPPPARKEKCEHPPVREFLAALPQTTPRELYDEVARRGYVGQDSARQMICLAAFRHIQRLKRIFLEDVNPRDIPPRDNCLFIGPTGTGKTCLAQTLFREILGLPLALIDATTLTETGYVGEDSALIGTQLFAATRGNLPWAECGVCIIDEFDKLAASTETRNSLSPRHEAARFGAQRSLLKVMEEDAVLDFFHGPHEGSRRGTRKHLRTANVLFLCCGTFSGWEATRQTSAAAIGFNSAPRPATADDDLEALRKYGLMSEILGRIALIARFNPLSFEEMTQILERNVIRRFEHELRLSGMTLDIAPPVKRLMIEQAMARKTGARGLTAHLAEHINAACFAAYSAPRKVKSIRLYTDNQGIQWDLDIQLPPPLPEPERAREMQY
ncbi:MAG: AAA family ATPase [Candidatus Marinimicrobia bacterium]|nr:AAA family ATPase [Candidatus Neomarinimicrobiota bacterium]